MAEFITRYLKKINISEISYDDFTSFLKESIEENLHLEYKPRGFLVDRHGNVLKPKANEVIGFDNLAKIICGFANAAGGLLVLGVKEKNESFKGRIIKRRPGPIKALPPSITREMIENNLMAKIEFPIDGVTILPLRRTIRSKNCVYLIDVPQSTRVPHRANGLHYYQRHNFSTIEMEHFQIADLFGKRLSPDLEIAFENIQVTQGEQPNKELIRHFRFDVVFQNRGRAAAKYVTCLLSSLQGADWANTPASWIRHSNGTTCQYETKTDRIIYPGLGHMAGTITYGKRLNSLEDKPIDLVLNIQLHADEMAGKNKMYVIDGTTGQIKFL